MEHKFDIYTVSLIYFPLQVSKNLIVKYMRRSLNLGGILHKDLD